jgi:hypothetical protein
MTCGSGKSLAYTGFSYVGPAAGVADADAGGCDAVSVAVALDVGSVPVDGLASAVGAAALGVPASGVEVDNAPDEGVVVESALDEGGVLDWGPAHAEAAATNRSAVVRPRSRVRATADQPLRPVVAMLRMM